MSANLKKLLTLLSLVLIVYASFSVGNYYGENKCALCSPSDFDFSLFWQAYHEIVNNYVDKGTIDNQKILYGAIAGMAKSLNDPYTVFFPPEEKKQFLEDIAGQFSGVGMEIGVKDGQLQVVSPFEGTPAQKAGLRPGDKIIEINGTSSSDITVDEAANLIRGPKGTEVTLTIQRESWKEPKEIKIIRDVIEIPTVKWELKDNGVAYLKIYQFSQTSALDFQKMANEILNSKAKKIVLDLRGNPGGLLNQAEEIAGWFLKRGEIIDIVQGKEREEHKAKGNEKLLNYPIVILMDKGTASGAEILAGALKDDRQVQLIGEDSFGKGLVQETENLADGSLLKITTAKWFTPKGTSISHVGLTADIKVEMTEADYTGGKDPQLEKALEIINK